MKKITLVIPTFNSGKYLPELVKRLKLLKGLRVIFVDDGSSEEDQQQLKSLAGDIDAQVVFNQHRGVSFARNTGLSRAETPYVAFLDSDDLIDSNAFQAIIDAFDVTAKYDIYSFANGQPDVVYTENQSKLDLVKQILKLIPSKQCIPAPFSKIYRVEMLIKHKVFFDANIKVGEDMLFNAKAFLVAKNVLISGKSFYLYRQNLDSVTHKAEYNIVTNNRYFLNALSELVFTYLEEKEAKRWFQEMAMITWVSDSFQAVIQSKNNVPLDKLRQSLLGHVDRRKLFFNTLPLQRKVLEWLLIFRQYGVTRRLIGNRKKFDVKLAAADAFVEV